MLVTDIFKNTFDIKENIKINVLDRAEVSKYFNLDNKEGFFKLNDYNDFKINSWLMNNCIDNYYEDTKKDLIVYSYWYKGLPECHIGVKNNQIFQIKGYNNRPVKLLFCKTIMSFVKNFNLNEQELKNIYFYKQNNEYKFIDSVTYIDKLYIYQDILLKNKKIEYMKCFNSDIFLKNTTINECISINCNFIGRLNCQNLYQFI